MTQSMISPHLKQVARRTGWKDRIVEAARAAGAATVEQIAFAICMRACEQSDDALYGMSREQQLFWSDMRVSSRSEQMRRARGMALSCSGLGGQQYDDAHTYVSITSYHDLRVHPPFAVDYN